MVLWEDQGVAYSHNTSRGLKFRKHLHILKIVEAAKVYILKRILESLDGFKYFPFDEQDKVVTPSNTFPNSVIIFDDVACEKQSHREPFSQWEDTRT